jgi:hypothetical protein
VLVSVSAAAGPSMTVTGAGGTAGAQVGLVDVAVHVVPVVEPGVQTGVAVPTVHVVPAVPAVQAGSVDVAVHVVPVVVPGVQAGVDVAVQVVPVVVPVVQGGVDVAVHVVPVVVPGVQAGVVVAVQAVLFVAVVQAGSVDVAVHVVPVVAGGAGVVVSAAGVEAAAASVLSAGVVSTGVASTAAGAFGSTAVAAFASTPVAAAADASVPSGDGAGGVAAAGGVLVAGGAGVFWNDAGSMPTLLETTGVEPVVLADGPPPNAVGSTPTELVTIGGAGALDVGGEPDAPGKIDAEVDDSGAAGVTLRLSLTIGTRTLCVNGCVDAIDCVACLFAAGCLKTRGGAAACTFGALAGTAAEGTRSTGKRRGTTLRAWRECTRGGGCKYAALMSGAVYT